MPNFVNLLDIIYPVGSIYFSTSSTSPASSVGGTWTQIKDCTLAAGGNVYGQPDRYASSDMITTLEIPDHQHEVVAWNATSATYTPCAFWATNAGGGNIWAMLSYGNPAGSTGWNLWTKGTWRIDANGNLVAEQKAHIPYHYSLYVWKRTA
nr:MAG TPA: baseplate protein [Caudoviricetes sp.]